MGFKDTFDTGIGAWQEEDSPLESDQNVFFEGGGALHPTNTDENQNLGARSFTQDSYETLSWYYRETSDSFGHVLRVAQSGTIVLSAGTNNPQWTLQDGNGFSEIDSGDDTYEVWVLVEVTIDWASGTFDITFTRQSDNKSVSSTGRPLVNNPGTFNELLWRGYSNDSIRTVDADTQWLDTVQVGQVAFKGFGTATASGVGTLSSRRSLSGSGQGVASGSGEIFRIPLSGSGEGTATGTATIANNVPLDGRGTARALGSGSLLRKSDIRGDGEGLATGQGVLRERRAFSGSGQGTAVGSATILSARIFAGSGVGRAIGSAELGDIKAHWVVVDGSVESEDAGDAFNISDLDTSKVHVFQVLALDTAYNFSRPATLEVSPLTISKEAATATSISVEVQTPDGDLHQTIELLRATSQNGTYSKIHEFTDPADTQTYLDTGLDEGKEYFYKARSTQSGITVESEATGIANVFLASLDVSGQSVSFGETPVYVPLGSAPQGFWDAYETDRTIAVYDRQGNRIPGYLAEVDTQNETGTFYVKPTVDTSDTDLYIRVESADPPAPDEQFGRNEVFSDFEAVWLMTEDPGQEDAVVDATGNGNDGVFGGNMDNADLVDGIFGRAYDLDGSNDILEILQLELNQSYPELTAEVWFRTTSDGIQLSFDRNEYFRMEIGGSQDGGNFGTSFYAGGGTRDNLNASSPYSDGNWHKGTFVYDQGTARLLVDGDVEDTESYGPEIGTGNTRYGFFGVGSEAGQAGGDKGPTNYHEGRLGASRFAFRALSNEEVDFAHKNERNPASVVTLGDRNSWELFQTASLETEIQGEVRYEDPSLVDKIEILRASQQGGPYQTIETINDPSSRLNSFTDSGLSQDTTYYYKAQAVIDGNVQTQSAEYDFATKPPLPSSITFDNQGATGKLGPSSTSYSWESTYPDFDVTIIGDGIQEFEVPETGTYRIIAKGGQGGRDSNQNGEPGGQGARIEGEFDLNEGDVLRIAVGQKGTDGDGVGGGGGASHVALYDTGSDTYTELISAAGGGGGGYYQGGEGNATLATDDGAGGGCCPAAGFRGNASIDQLQEAAQAFVNGAQGSAGDQGGGTGGFGGGAGSESDSSGINAQDDFGGGGGYKGGDGPCNSASDGGDSYNDGVNQTNVSGDNTGMGEVTLDLTFV